MATDLASPAIMHLSQRVLLDIIISVYDNHLHHASVLPRQVLDGPLKQVVCSYIPLPLLLRLVSIIRVYGYVVRFLQSIQWKEHKVNLYEIWNIMIGEKKISYHTTIQALDISFLYGGGVQIKPNYGNKPVHYIHRLLKFVCMAHVHLQWYMYVVGSIVEDDKLMLHGCGYSHTLM